MPLVDTLSALFKNAENQAVNFVTESQISLTEFVIESQISLFEFCFKTQRNSNQTQINSLQTQINSYQAQINSEKGTVRPPSLLAHKPRQKPTFVTCSLLASSICKSKQRRGKKKIFHFFQRTPTKRSLKISLQAEVP